MIRFSPLEFTTDLTAKEVINTLTSPLFITCILVLSFLLRRTFRSINRKLIYSSALDAETSTYFYTMTISILIYLPIHILPNRGEELDTFSVLVVPALFLGKKLLIKSVSIFLQNKNERRPSDMTLNGLLVQSNREKSNEIDFVEGINNMIPIIFIGYTSTILNMLILLPTIIFIIYIVAIVEKYRIKRFYSLTNMKSVNYMLKAFTVFRWDCFCAFGLYFIFLKSYIDEVSSQVWYVACFGLLGILCYLCWPASLEDQVRTEFNHRNLNKHYDSVSTEFPYFYQTQDPLKRITN